MLSAVLRLASSLARLAASLASAAPMHLWTTCLAIFGFSSRYVVSPELTIESTSPLISELPSLRLVCPSNWGSETLTDITADSPSRVSLLVIFIRCLSIPFVSA